MSTPKENTLNPVSLALQGVGLVVLIVLCYLGLNYLWSASSVLPLVVSLLGAILLFIAVFLLTKMKNLKENKGVRPAEIALWVLYGLLAIASFFPIAHYANVELAAKRSIQEDARARLAELTTMSQTYHRDVDGRVDEIKQAIKEIASDVGAGGSPTAAAAAAEKYGISAPDIKNRDDLAAYYEEEADSKKDIYLAAATENSTGENLEEREERYRDFINQKTVIINDWDRSQIYETLNDIDAEIADYKVYLGDLYVANNPSESVWDEQEFEYAEETASIENIINSPSAVRGKYAEETGVLIPLIILLLVHLFIISPYLLLDRLGKRIFRNPEGHNRTGNVGGVET